MSMRKEVVIKLPDAVRNEDSLSLARAERRRFSRVPVLRPVRYESERFGETRSRMLDLSAGGAYIESPVVPEGSRIELEFSLINGYTVRATAVVRYVVLGSGMGVEFEDISDKDLEQISVFIASFRSHAGVS